LDRIPWKSFRLHHWNGAAQSRELRMIELKEEIDELCRRLGKRRAMGRSNLKLIAFPRPPKLRQNRGMQLFVLKNSSI
jgi:hypothetical protein